MKDENMQLKLSK